MHAALLFPTEYLIAADLKGADVTLTISRVVIETVMTSKGKEIKPMLHFAEMESRPPKSRKRLILNRTNAKAIAKLYGKETDDWQGKRITVYPTTCDAFGESDVDCVRVRKAVPKGKASQRSEPAPVDAELPEPPPGELETDQ